MSENFIKTSDNDTADKLRNSGFTEISRDGEFYVFLNNGKSNFSTNDERKIIRTNLLNM